MSGQATAVFSVWVYLAQSPLLWLTVTLVAYLIADALSSRSGRHPLANPVLIAVVLIAALLVGTGTSYTSYFDGAQFIHFLLGPATVALAIPLYDNRAIVKRAIVPMAAALVAGSVTALVSAVMISRFLGATAEVQASIAPKSVTAGIAMGISQSIGGDPTLTAVLVLLTGIFGAIVVTPLMKLLRITDFRARGFAVGLAAHGIGTARAFQVNELAGTFAGIAMGLNALATAILVPLVLHFLRF